MIHDLICITGQQGSINSGYMSVTCMSRGKIFRARLGICCIRGEHKVGGRRVSTTDLFDISTIHVEDAGLTGRTETGRTETGLANVLAGVLQVDSVSVDSHFFDDLGADSMVMAQFCARVRKRVDLPAVSMKDIYQHPTIRSLAAACAGRAPRPAPSVETLPRESLATPPTATRTEPTVPKAAAALPATTW